MTVYDATQSAAQPVAQPERSAHEFSLDGSYQLHPSVAIRPEPFGALVYHYGNRKLVFLKSATIVEVVKSLGRHSSVHEALASAGVPAQRVGPYEIALRSMFSSNMIVVRS